MVGRPQDIFPLLKSFHLGDISAGIAIITYFLGTKKVGQNVRSLREAKLFMLFCAISALCIPFGYYPREGLFFLWDFFIKFGIYLYLFAKLITDEEHFQGIINTLILCGLIMSLAAMSVMNAGVRTKILGSAYDPNDLALLIVTILPISITQGLSTPNRFWKIICFGGSMLFVITLIGTQSRGGFLGLTVATISFFFTRTPGFSKRKLLFISIGLAITFAIYVGVEYKERLQTIFEDVSSIEAGSGRVLIWKRAIYMAKDNPLLGVGPTAFATAYGSYLSNDKFTGELALKEDSWAPYTWKAVHNSFLQVLVELGIPGFLVFLAIIIQCFRNLRQIQTLASERWQIALSFQAIGLKVALTGFIICAFFLTHAYSPFIYIFLFLSGAMARFCENTHSDGKSDIPESYSVRATASEHNSIQQTT